MRLGRELLYVFFFVFVVCLAPKRGTRNAEDEAPLQFSFHSVRLSIWTYERKTASFFFAVFSRLALRLLLGMFLPRHPGLGPESSYLSAVPPGNKRFIARTPRGFA